MVQMVREKKVKLKKTSPDEAEKRCAERFDKRKSEYRKGDKCRYPKEEMKEYWKILRSEPLMQEYYPDVPELRVDAPQMAAAPAPPPPPATTAKDVLLLHGQYYVRVGAPHMAAGVGTHEPEAAAPAQAEPAAAPARPPAAGRSAQRAAPTPVPPLPPDMVASFLSKRPARAARTIAQPESRHSGPAIQEI